MPQLFPNRPLNTKIVKNLRAYNTTNASSRAFNSPERMFAYHSPNTCFIDYASSKLIDKQATINAFCRIVLTDKLIVYKIQERNSSGMFETRYYNVNGELVPDADAIENIYCLSRQFSKDKLIEIQNRINPQPRQTVSADELRAVLEDTSQRIQSTQEQINTNLIYSYHRGPRDMIFHKNENDSDDEKRFFGIELEIDASRDINASSTKKHRLATRIHQLMNDGNYNSLLKFELDISLGQYGFEIITQPMTMKYILTNKEKFKEMMTLIEQENYSSHDSGRCGMHIHVSRNALTPEMIDNLYLMFENFKNEIIAFSRRTENTMNWCKFITDHYSNCPDTITDEYIKSHKPSGNSHHSAINNGNSNTVEFRIFRGTTKLRTFIANIQLIDNMIELSKKEDITGLTWNQIINYNDEYTELISYNEKRGIVSKHELSKNINKIEIISRPVILVRPFQMSLEGDN